MGTIKVNLARKHNDSLSIKTSNITTLLWIDLKFATSIVYPLDKLLNNLCKNLMDILEILNYISITVFLCLSVSEKEKIMNANHNILHHLLASCAVGRAVDLARLPT